MGVEKKLWTIGQKLGLATVCIFFVAAVSLVSFVNWKMDQEALGDAKTVAQVILDRTLATHTYFTDQLKPNLFALLAQTDLPKKYFDPTLMSSTFAVRSIDGYSKTISPENYYYKSATINARSPENEADHLERKFIENLYDDPQLQEKEEIREFDGVPYFVFMRRGETLSEGCIRCHGDPEEAPAELVAIYGSERSFHKKAGDIASVVSIRIPLAAAYARVDRFALELSSWLVAGFLVLWTVQWLVTRRLLVKPLEGIRNKAVKITSDKRHLGEQLEPASVRELHEVATAFNAMSSGLRRKTDDMENIIEQRTAELKELNGQLQQDILERQQVEARLREQERRLNHLAYHDPLTDLPNRVLFQDRLQQALAKARRSTQKVALLFIDLDRFKEVNDSLGHEVGDRLLCEVARRLSDCIRKADTAARLGGDEFVVILEDVKDLTNLGLVAEKILQRLAEPYLVAEQSIEVTVSIGVSLFPDHAKDANALVGCADSAMYNAKDLGRNNVRFYGAGS